MSKSFDPYHKWLGIPEREQPANYYRLLGVELFESDADVIESAADQRVAHLRSFQSGPNSKLSQKLLTEVSTAKVTLLNPEKRRKYDAQLNATLPADDPLAALPAAETVFQSTAATFEPAPQFGANVNVNRTSPSSRRAPSWLIPAVLVGGSLMLMLVVVLVYMVIGSVSGDPNEGIARVDGDVQPSPAVVPVDPVDPKPPVVKPQPEPVAPNPFVPPVEPDPVEPKPPLPDKPDPDPPTTTPPDTTPPDTTPPEPSPPKTEPKPSPPEPVRKQLIPTVAEQQPIDELMRSTFDFSVAESPEQKSALAKKLLDLAVDPSAKPIEQYVFITTAGNLELEAGNIASSLKCVEKLAEGFEFDHVRKEYELLIKAAEEYKQVKDIASLASVSPPFINRAITANRIDLASTVAEDVYKATLARGVPTETRKAAFDEKNRLNDLSKEWEKIGAAITALEDNPDDPEKNLIAGEWFCFSQGDWNRGLTHLAKSNDAVLQPLAKQELESTGSYTELIDIAAGWRKASTDASGERKVAMRERAARCYLLAQAVAPKGSEEETQLNLVFKAIGDVSEARQAIIRERQPEGKKILFIRFEGGERKTAESASKRFFLEAEFVGNFDMNRTDYSAYHTIMVGSNGMDYWQKDEKKEPKAFQHLERFIREGGHLVVFGTYNGRNFHHLKRFGVTTGFTHAGAFERNGEATELFLKGVEYLAPENNKLTSAGNLKVSSPHTIILKRGPGSTAGDPVLATIPVDEGRLTTTLCEPNWQGDLWIITAMTSWVARDAPIPNDLTNP